MPSAAVNRIVNKIEFGNLSQEDNGQLAAIVMSQGSVDREMVEALMNELSGDDRYELATQIANWVEQNPPD
jgi:hypothetical protein